VTQTSEVARPVTAGQPAAEPATEPAAEPAAGSPSRRDRLRAATIEEIVQTARRILVKDGPEAVSLRAIAREMGMTAPGLYRYFGSYEELVRYLTASIFTELGNDIHLAIEAAGPPAGQAAAGEPVRAMLAVKMVAACREFRRWSLNHKGEFALLFGVPLPGLDDGRYDIADECNLAFAGTFFALFLEAGLRGQLARYRDALGTDIPLGAVVTFLRCWTVLYGAVAMEVFGHMRFALADPAPMFEITLGDLAALVGLRYPL
jgi:AcrR family transcriptional regulator